MAKMKADAGNVIEQTKALSKPIERPMIDIEISRLDRFDLAGSLLVVADKRDRDAAKLDGVKRANMEARAIRLRRLAEELKA